MSLLLDGEGTIEDLLRPVKLPPAERQQQSTAYPEYFGDGKLVLQGIRQLLEEYTGEVVPQEEQDPAKRASVFVSFGARFAASLAAVDSQPAGAHQYPFASVCEYLSTLLDALREAFLSELLLLPHGAEPLCMTVVVFAQCEKICLACIERLLVSGDITVERSLVSLCRRMVSFSRELMEMAKSEVAKLLWPQVDTDELQGSPFWIGAIADWVEASMEVVLLLAKAAEHPQNSSLAAGRWAESSKKGRMLGLHKLASAESLANDKEACLLTDVDARIRKALDSVDDSVRRVLGGPELPGSVVDITSAQENPEKVWGKAGEEARRQALGPGLLASEE